MPEVVEVRKFSGDKLQAAIENALAKLPADQKLAAVAHVDGSGASLSLVAKIGKQWSVAAACYKPYGKPLAYEAEVVWSPF